MASDEWRLQAESEIRKALSRYCSALDRRDFELVRSNYHDDATDDHGVFRGTVDEFIDFARNFVQRFERTFHFLGNTLIEISDREHARSESYVIAIHRLAATNTQPARDHIVGARYIDDFEHRGSAWKIARRVAALDWTRTDPVTPGWTIPESTP